MINYIEYYKNKNNVFLLNHVITVINLYIYHTVNKQCIS